MLSGNRRKFLDIQRDDDTKQDPDAATEITTLLHGSAEHTKFHLQQIENEITSLLLKYHDEDGGLSTLSDEDKSVIQSLLSEANGVVKKAKEQKISSDDVDVFSFRHRLRTLFLSSFVKMEEEKGDGKEEEDIFDELARKLHVKFDHSKPADAAVLGAASDENEEKLTNESDFNVNDKIKGLIAECRRSGDISRYELCFCHFQKPNFMRFEQMGTADSPRRQSPRCCSRLPFWMNLNFRRSASGICWE